MNPFNRSFIFVIILSLISCPIGFSWADRGSVRISSLERAQQDVLERDVTSLGAEPDQHDETIVDLDELKPQQRNLDGYPREKSIEPARVNEQRVGPSDETIDGGKVKALVERMSAVARVVIAKRFRFLDPRTSTLRTLDQGEGFATCFLVGAEWIMTNNHILPDKETCDFMHVQFNYERDSKGIISSSEEFTLDPDAGFITSAEMDYTLVCTRKKDGHFPGEKYGVIPLQKGIVIAPAKSSCKTVNKDGKVAIELADHPDGQPIIIIQHPNGGYKRIALRDNNLECLFEKGLLYTADTDGGSSGSPVFNGDLDCIGIHAYYDEQLKRNAGFRLEVIINDLLQRSKSDPHFPQALLSCIHY